MQITLRAVRVAHGFSIEEVAERCGVSFKTIEEVESDTSNIEYGLLLKMTGLYGFSADNIYLGSELEYHKKLRSNI